MTVQRGGPETPGGPPRPGPRRLGSVRPEGSMPALPTPPELVTVWPHLLFRELLAVLIALILLIAASILFNAPLEEPASPSVTPNPAKAPWYFVGLQELLVYFDPWMAGVLVPFVIILGLCAIPYIDPSQRGGGVYSRRERPLAFALFTIGLVGWFLLIVIGIWFRGPGWGWVWPWRGAGAAPPVEVATSLPNALGAPLLLAYFLGGGWVIVRLTRFREGFTTGRRWTFAILLLAMAGVGVKILMRLVFGIKYVVSFPQIGFNI